ncbi:MAG TPA: S8 family serine peptidase, partial [Longimicrobium sp.]|nr:S8 family serine peptidase [Longimicrobium sp.]
MTRRSPTRLLAVLAAASLCACADRTADTPLASGAAPLLSEDPLAEIDGNYLVRFTGGVPAGFAERVAALGGAVIFAHDGAGIGAVSGVSAEAAAELGALPGVGEVAADAVTRLDTPAGEILEWEPEGAVASPTDPTTARNYARQWQFAAIGAPTAWAAGRLGSPAVRVAILDTGLDYGHPDLVGRVDLAASRSFIPSDNPVIQANFPGAHPIADLHYHGTHMGATVASNAVIGAGVTSRVTLVGVKTCSRLGQCPVSAAVAGLLYAADLGVDVANLSHGTLFFLRVDGQFAGRGGTLHAFIHRAFTYAHAKGVTVVIAAGNSAIDMDHFRDLYLAYCNTPTVICVSATAPTAAPGFGGPFFNVDSIAPYTNYGRSAITVAAPGGRIVTT